jgi:hypothetical protein
LSRGSYVTKGTLLDPDAPVAHQRGGGPLPWDAASHGWDALNASLPVGPVSHDNSTKTVNAPVTNNITVNGSDPQSTAAMVGMHLDRTSNDPSRNLQGAFQ